MSEMLRSRQDRECRGGQRPLSSEQGKVADVLEWCVWGAPDRRRQVAASLHIANHTFGIHSIYALDVAHNL